MTRIVLSRAQEATTTNTEPIRAQHPKCQSASQTKSRSQDTTAQSASLVDCCALQLDKINHALEIDFTQHILSDTDYVYSLPAIGTAIVLGPEFQ